jgi:hypothetical protein
MESSSFDLFRFGQMATGITKKTFFILHTSFPDTIRSTECEPPKKLANILVDKCETWSVLLANLSGVGVGGWPKNSFVCQNFGIDSKPIELFFLTWVTRFS